MKSDIEAAALAEAKAFAEKTPVLVLAKDKDPVGDEEEDSKDEEDFKEPLESPTTVVSPTSTVGKE